MLSRNIESIRSTHILFDNISTIGIDLKIIALINQLINLGIDIDIYIYGIIKKNHIFLAYSGENRRI